MFAQTCCVFPGDGNRLPAPEPLRFIVDFARHHCFSRSNDGLPRLFEDAGRHAGRERFFAQSLNRLRKTSGADVDPSYLKAIHRSKRLDAAPGDSTAKNIVLRAQ